MTDQISHVVARVGPKRSAIRTLVESSDDIAACLQVVRYFDADDGEEEVITVTGDLQKLSGQHQLLGWHLSAEVLDFVRDVHAEIDVDEYGGSPVDRPEAAAQAPGGAWAAVDPSSVSSGVTH